MWSDAVRADNREEKAAIVLAVPRAQKTNSGVLSASQLPRTSHAMGQPFLLPPSAIGSSKGGKGLAAN